jgi:hypothetical protein
LTVDPAERAVLSEVLEGCPETVIEVIRAF